MLFPELAQFTDIALFLLRVFIAAIFFTSGWSHVTQPKERAESMGMSTTMTFIVGAIEVVGAVMLVLGVWPQIGAILLIAIMLGAIYKKMLVWKTGFWGDDGQGWYYDALYAVCNLVILTTGGGAIALT